jgi:hypothetical protein
LIKILNNSEPKSHKMLVSADFTHKQVQNADISRKVL